MFTGAEPKRARIKLSWCGARTNQARLVGINCDLVCVSYAINWCIGYIVDLAVIMAYVCVPETFTNAILDAVMRCYHIKFCYKCNQAKL